MSKEFQRKDNHCTNRIDDSWRKPRGSDNKQRLGKKGHPKAVDTGYRTKKEDRHKWNDKTVITVTSTEELDDIDNKTEAARIPSMGRRKKTPLVEHAVKNDIDIVNLDAEAYIQNTEDFLKERRERQKRREEEQKKKEAEKAAEEGESAEETDDQATNEDEEVEADASDDSDKASATDIEEDTALISAEDAPTSDNTVKEIKAWLDDHDIEYTSSMLKADLLDLVNEHTEDES